MRLSHTIALTFLIIVFLSSSASAESQYYRCHAKFMIETIDGNISDGYTDDASSCAAIKDSLENTEYLKTEFNLVPSKDTFTYFTDRIEYEYPIRKKWNKNILYII